MSDDGGRGSHFDRALDAVWHLQDDPKTLLNPVAELRPKYRRRRQQIAQSTQLNEAMDVALRLGTVFLAGGAPTDHVESAVFAAGTALGLEPFEVDITNKAITLSVPPGARRPGVTMLRVVRTRAKHHARLAAAHELVLDLTGGEITKEQLLERLDLIERMPRPYPRWFVTLGWGVLAGSLVLRLGGGFLAASIAFFSATLVDRIGRVLNRHHAPELFLNATGALIATSVAVVMTSLEVPARSSLVVAGGIIALLPGMALVVAAQEAMGAFPVTAAARLVELSVGTAGIVAGVLGGLLVAGQLGVVMEVTELAPDTLGSLLLAVAAGGMAASASAVGSHAPAKVLLSAGVVGAVGIVVVKAVAAGITTTGVPEAVASVFVGALGTWLAARHRVPAVLLVVPGIIPMLPGLASYQGLLEISQGRLPEGAAVLFGALTVALAIAGGVLLGELFLSSVTRRGGHGVPVGASGASATVVGMLAPVVTPAPATGSLPRQREGASSRGASTGSAAALGGSAPGTGRSAAGTSGPAAGAGNLAAGAGRSAAGTSRPATSASARTGPDGERPAAGHPAAARSGAGTPTPSTSSVTGAPARGRAATARDAERPRVGGPGGAKPDAGKPGQGKPDSGKPDAGKPDSGTPDSGRPYAAKPDAAKPDAKADEAKPDTATPDEAKPDTATPDTATPDEAKPDEAKPTSREEGSHARGRSPGRAESPPTESLPRTGSVPASATAALPAVRPGPSPAAEADEGEPPDEGSGETPDEPPPTRAAPGPKPPAGPRPAAPVRRPIMPKSERPLTWR